MPYEDLRLRGSTETSLERRVGLLNLKYSHYENELHEMAGRPEFKHMIASALRGQTHCKVLFAHLVATHLGRDAAIKLKLRGANHPFTLEGLR